MCVNIYDVAHGEVVHSMTGHMSWVLSVAASPDSKTFATGSADKTVKVCVCGGWSCRDAAQGRQLPPFLSFLPCCCGPAALRSPTDMLLTCS